MAFFDLKVFFMELCTQDYQIISISEQHLESFRDAVGSVAREQKYLAFLDAPTLEMTRAFVLENLQDDWPHVVAVIEDKVIGWCDITSLHRPVFAHSGVLGIGVLAPFRGRGIGEALMRPAIEKARSKGLTRIELTVREHNKPAISLYEKLGFKAEGLHRNAVRIGNKYENHISMALLFE
jgi:ribosomal protein S18 acetylase RimI-like enzyme